MAQLKPGERAPEFAAQDHNGQQVRLADYNDRKVFIYFFPKANTSG